MKQEFSIKYLGVTLDSELNWKSHISFVENKIKRSIGILSKLRYYINLSTLKNLYYSLIYPFLIYGILVWGNTYQATLHPLVILQKRMIRIITFTNYYEHTSPLFKSLNILKIHDLVSFHVAVFVKKFHDQLLPPVFDTFFKPVNCVHEYSTRFSVNQTFFTPKVRTNYGIFNIRFQGTKIWNSIAESTKSLPLSKFKKKNKEKMIEKY